MNANANAVRLCTALAQAANLPLDQAERFIREIVKEIERARSEGRSEQKGCCRLCEISRSDYGKQ